MATTLFLIATVVIVGAAHGKFVWQNDNDWPGFQPLKIQMPTPPFAPFPPFQPFPPMQPFQPFPPSFLNIPPPHIISPDEIRNAKPGPNGVYNGVVVSSSSKAIVDKDGKVIRQGGTSVLTNQDGTVHEYKQGNAPPDLNKPIKMPKLDFLEFDDDFPKVQAPFEPLKVEPVKFEPLVFEPIAPVDVEKIKKYKPKKNENFKGFSSSSSSSSITINGKTVEKGASRVLVNDNGKTDEQHAAFHKGDKDFGN